VKPNDRNSAAASAAAKAGKQKKQALALGGLVAVLAIVLFVQFGGDSPEGEVAAQALEQPATDASGAPVAAPDAGAAAPVAAAPSASGEAPADNPVLIKPVEGGLVRSPFTNFWNATARAGTAKQAQPEMAAPNVTLTATMPSAVRPLAIVDGQLRYVGDVIGGWTLVDIQARSISLRSPTKSVMTVEMPLLSGAARR
jgi:hypothetical protein